MVQKVTDGLIIGLTIICFVIKNIPIDGNLFPVEGPILRLCSCVQVEDTVETKNGIE
jgi:hypothetical protein